MSLQTPVSIRRLQRKLYRKAKAEPAYRFYLLYDKIYREDILRHAYDLARAHNGAPGVDGVTFAVIETTGREEWLAGIRKDLIEKTYRPAPVRRVLIPKPGGGERPLGIPTIRDRVVQTAAKLVLEPVFEADFEPSAYGYRPKRGAPDAIKEVYRLLCHGYTDVVDADLTKYFDTIPHHALLQSVARRIVDRQVLGLIKLWLKAPVEERDRLGRRWMTGGRHSTCGTPQGGVVSPLLANIYMHRFLKYWRQTGQATALQASVVNYADDFVILSRGHAAEALTWTRQVMTKLGLALNEAKTSVRDARQESFDFLGYTFGPQHYRKDGHWYLGASPSKKSVQRLKDKVGAILVSGNQAPWPEVRERLNSVLSGWSAYFRYGTRLMAYRAIDHHTYARVRRFLVQRHKVPTRGTRPDDPAALYAWYTQRGDRPELCIKDLKEACFADRLSCHRFWANQCRLLLHAAAYWLLDTIRRWLARLQVPHLQLGTLRLRLIKIGGWVRSRIEGLSLHLASSHPGESLWHLLATRPGR